MQLPAWNEALGLPRPWDQQWSLRMQQVLAFESDLLEYDDIFEGSQVDEAKTAELTEEAGAELADVEALGGAFEAIDELKTRLVRSQAERVRRIETGEQQVIGVNCFTETEPSPLTGDADVAHIMKVDHRTRPNRSPRGPLAPEAISRRWTRRWTPCVRWPRTPAPAATSWRPSLWPMPAGPPASGPARCVRCSGISSAHGHLAGGTGRRGELAPVRARTAALAERTGGPPRLLVAKPGLGSPQRGGADRRRRPGRRIRGDLPGDRADPRRNRRRRRGRRHRGAVHPLGLAHGAGARHPRPPPAWTPPSWWAGSSRPTTPRSCAGRAWPPCTPRRTTPSTASWRTSSAWRSASEPPHPDQAGHLPPGDRLRRSSMAPAEVLGQVIVIQLDRPADRCW